MLKSIIQFKIYDQLPYIILGTKIQINCFVSNFPPFCWEKIQQTQNMKELALLQWSDFQENRSTYYQNVRLSLDFSDVTLACEDDEGFTIEAHRFVLASGSSFFQRLLSRKKTSEHPHPLIFLTGMRRNHLEAVMDFLYLGETRVQQTELLEFLQAAQTLGVTGLLQQNHQKNSTENAAEKVEVTNQEAISQDLLVKEESDQINTNTLIEQTQPETTTSNLPEIQHNLEHVKENIYYSASLDLNLDYSRMTQSVPKAKARSHHLPGSSRRAPYWRHFSTSGRKAGCLLGGCKTPTVSMGKAGGRANNFAIKEHLRRNHKEAWAEYAQKKEEKEVEEDVE